MSLEPGLAPREADAAVGVRAHISDDLSVLLQIQPRGRVEVARLKPAADLVGLGRLVAREFGGGLVEDRGLGDLVPGMIRSNRHGGCSVGSRSVRARRDVLTPSATTPQS